MKPHRGSDIAKAVRTALTDRLDEMLAATRSLVEIDSGSRDVAGVTRVSDALAAWWVPLGFQDRTRLLPEFGPQRTLTRTDPLGQGKLVILGHADTVWPAGTTAGWRFSTGDGYACGPGVGDMKGCLVMATFAVGELVRLGALPCRETVFMIVPDEELGSAASRAWIEAECRDADRVLVLEPGRPGGGMVVGRGAVGALEARFRGRTAHVAVSFDQGVSALRAASAAVGELEALTDVENGVSVSVGVLRSGTARQVVPDLAEMLIDLRSADPLKSDALLAEVHGILARHATAPVTLETAGGWTRPCFPPERGEALFATAAGLAQELGIPLHPVVTRGGSDGCFPAAMGRPTLDGLGPICHDTCSRRERIEIQSLVDRGTLFAGLIASG